MEMTDVSHLFTHTDVSEGLVEPSEKAINIMEVYFFLTFLFLMLFFFFFFFFTILYFLATLQGMQCPNPQTQDQTHDPCSRSTES